RRADGLAGGRALGLRLATAARGDPADAARGEALRARRRADERLHALGRPVPQALRQPDGECEPWPRILHEPRFPWRVFAGRLSGEQAETSELGIGVAAARACG